MADLTLTDYDAVLKEYYSDQRLERMAYEENPYLALIPKHKNFYGRNYPLPIQYSTPQGISASFSQAQSSAEAGDYEQWTLLRKKYYGVATIDGETMLASEQDPGAFAEAATTEVDGIYHSVTRRLAVQLFTNHGGAIGQVGGTSTVTLTLSDAKDVTNFERGMNLDSSNTDGTSGSADGGTKVVTGIDRDLGTLTAGTNWTSAGNFSNSDYIFIKGDFGAALSGLASWIPASAPSATAFFGVDRTADATRLGGIRFTGTSYNIVDALTRSSARAHREGSKLSHWILNDIHWADLELSLEGKAIYDMAKSEDGRFGFNSIKLTTTKGPAQVVADFNCPSGRAYGLKMSTCGLYSLGMAPRLLDHDGVGKFLRQASSDGVEIRIGYYAQHAVQMPGHNVYCSLAT